MIKPKENCKWTENSVTPFSFVQYENSELRIYTLSEFLDIAEIFRREYGKNPFDEKAISWLVGELAPYIQTRVYADNRYKKRWNYIYSAKEINESAVQNSSTFAPSANKYKNLTTLDLKAYEKQNIAYLGTVTDGKIVSAAAANLSKQDETAREICVETSVDYRGCGYAASNTALLAKYLLENGYTALYLCGNDNEKSKITAEKAGLTQIGKRYDYTVYRRTGV